MKNIYGRNYIVIHEPIKDKHRRRVFERKLTYATDKGYVLVGRPYFHKIQKGGTNGTDRVYTIFGTALLRRREGGV
jgi:hypothetical protein